VRLALALAIALLGLLLVPPAHATGTGAFTEHSFAATATTPARNYWLYVPTNTAPGRPLVVFLHGCNETALEAAQASHFNDLADQQGFVVVYPEQVVSAGSSAPIADGNGIGCWNWFLPQDQARGSGEPGAIAGITQAVMASEGTDPARVYVEGISAGADMAVILGATYPDLFRAVGSLAGCPYATCTDLSGALTHQAMGPYARVVPLFVENGSADTVNPVTNSVALVESWMGADDLADDGQANGSISRLPVSTTTYQADQVPAPGTGDACIHPNSLTCPGGVVGFQRSYPYTVITYQGDLAELWVIQGMQHAHPDAPGDGPYTDPLGPDITAASYAFFQGSVR